MDFVFTLFGNWALLVFLLVLVICACSEQRKFVCTEERHNAHVRVSKGEAECDRVLKKLFPHRRFQKIRPDWLVNDYPGRRHPVQNLELDFYNETELLAVEFQGRQHRECVPDFHKNGTSSLWAQQQRDQRKRELCKRRGVDLIEVWFDTPDIERFLTSHPLIVTRIR